MNAGDLRDRVTFRRRPIIDARTRGDYADLRGAWANYRRLSGREAMQAGREVAIEEGTLRLRHPGPAGDITIADRVTIRARDFAVVAVGTPDRHLGMVELTVRSDLKK